MQIDCIHHLNIRCAPGELEAVARFYSEIAGLARGHRPRLRNEGIWLYRGEQPVVHVTARCTEGFVQREHRGSIDHVAFGASGAADFLRRLSAIGIPFEQQNVAGAGFQVFVHDPVGTAVEFNFPNSEAPDAVAIGTLAPANTLSRNRE